MNVQNKLKISFAASISMIFFIGQLRSVGRTIGFSLLFIRLEKRRWGMEINAARKKISPHISHRIRWFGIQLLETMLFYFQIDGGKRRELRFGRHFFIKEFSIRFLFPQIDLHMSVDKWFWIMESGFRRIFTVAFLFLALAEALTLRCQFPNPAGQSLTFYYLT